MESRDYIDPHIVTAIANMVDRRAAGRFHPGLLELGLFGGLDLDGYMREDYDREVTYMYMPEHSAYHPIHTTIDGPMPDHIYTNNRYPKPLRHLPRPQYTPEEPVSPQPERPDKKVKSKATKKRIKKRRQKEKKRLEKLKREQQKPKKNTEGKEESAEAKSVARVTAAGADGQSSLDSDSSSSSDHSEEEEESEESEEESEAAEELDLNSSFVNTAALIVKRKLEQKEPKSKPEKEEKKAPVKPEAEPIIDKPVPRELPTTTTTTTTAAKPVPSKDISATPINYKPIHEDNVKISTELATLGNQHASSGRFDMAVKYFTAAIKYNPKEFKLFGNRSFCLERIQQYEKALSDAQLSLNMAPGWEKGLYRKGRALVGLKRYEEAASTFTEVLKLDSSCTEAAQELMRVQITQLSEYGFSREQSSNALIIHGSLSKALEVLTKLNHPSEPGTIYKVPVLPPAVGEKPPRAPPIPSDPRGSLPSAFQQDPSPPLPNRNPPAPDTTNVLPKAAPKPPPPVKTQPVPPPSSVELFPIWVGNVPSITTTSLLTALFGRVGKIHSIKVLLFKRCAFVNFTTQEHCDQAIRQFCGFELLGCKLTLRYPDRIPHGMGMSRTALKADDLQEDTFRQRDNGHWRK